MCVPRRSVNVQIVYCQYSKWVIYVSVAQSDSTLIVSDGRLALTKHFSGWSQARRLPSIIFPSYASIAFTTTITALFSKRVTWKRYFMVAIESTWIRYFLWDQVSGQLSTSGIVTWVWRLSSRSACHMILVIRVYSRRQTPVVEQRGLLDVGYKVNSALRHAIAVHVLVHINIFVK